MEIVASQTQGPGSSLANHDSVPQDPTEFPANDPIDVLARGPSVSTFLKGYDDFLRDDGDATLYFGPDILHPSRVGNLRALDRLVEISLKEPFGNNGLSVGSRQTKVSVGSAPLIDLTVDWQRSGFDPSVARHVTELTGEDDEFPKTPRRNLNLDKSTSKDSFEGAGGHGRPSIPVNQLRLATQGTFTIPLK